MAINMMIITIVNYYNDNDCSHCNGSNDSNVDINHDNNNGDNESKISNVYFKEFKSLSKNFYGQ